MHSVRALKNFQSLNINQFTLLLKVSLMRKRKSEHLLEHWRDHSVSLSILTLNGLKFWIRRRNLFGLPTRLSQTCRFSRMPLLILIDWSWLVWAFYFYFTLFSFYPLFHFSPCLIFVSLSQDKKRKRKKMKEEEKSVVNRGKKEKGSLLQIPFLWKIPCLVMFCFVLLSFVLFCFVLFCIVLFVDLIGLWLVAVGRKERKKEGKKVSKWIIWRHQQKWGGKEKKNKR